MMAYEKKRGTSPLILNLGWTGCRTRIMGPPLYLRGTHLLGGWVCPTADVVALENTKFYSSCRELNDPSVVQFAALSLH